jgi:hypothetical protein
MNTSTITAKIQPVIAFIKQHSVTLFAVFFLGMYGFLVYRINVLTEAEPDAAAIGDSLSTVKRLKIDQDSIDKILELEEQNIEVKTLFQEARANPFNE